MTLGEGLPRLAGPAQERWRMEGAFCWAASGDVLRLPQKMQQLQSDITSCIALHTHPDGSPPAHSASAPPQNLTLQHDWKTSEQLKSSSAGDLAQVWKSAFSAKLGATQPLLSQTEHLHMPEHGQRFIKVLKVQLAITRGVQSWKQPEMNKLTAGFESAAFKLSHEMTQLLDPGANRSSATWAEFEELVVRGYLATPAHTNASDSATQTGSSRSTRLQARTVAEPIIATVALMAQSGLPCYSRGAPVDNLRRRFHLEMSEKQLSLCYTRGMTVLLERAHSPPAEACAHHVHGHVDMPLHEMRLPHSCVKSSMMRTPNGPLVAVAHGSDRYMKKVKDDVAYVSGVHLKEGHHRLNAGLTYLGGHIILYKVRSQSGIAGHLCAVPICQTPCDDASADTKFPFVNVDGNLPSLNPCHDATRLAFKGATRTFACTS
eukprot:1146653-Pelagomonas_calceolata.AAC.1